MTAPAIIHEFGVLGNRSRPFSSGAFKLKGTALNSALIRIFVRRGIGQFFCLSEMPVFPST
jgi:hypothetical protein